MLGSPCDPLLDYRHGHRLRFQPPLHLCLPSSLVFLSPLLPHLLASKHPLTGQIFGCFALSVFQARVPTAPQTSPILLTGMASAEVASQRPAWSHDEYFLVCPHEKNLLKIRCRWRRLGKGLPLLFLLINQLIFNCRHSPPLCEGPVNRNSKCRFIPLLLGVQGCTLGSATASITVGGYLRNAMMDWLGKAPPHCPQAAIQLVMVRGRHYYSYTADGSQSKQSWDEVSDPPSAFSWDTKEKKLQRHWGGTFDLNSDLLCKLPHQILLISFFASFSLFSQSLQISALCVHTQTQQGRFIPLLPTMPESLFPPRTPPTTLQ